MCRNHFKCMRVSEMAISAGEISQVRANKFFFPSPRNKFEKGYDSVFPFDPGTGPGFEDFPAYCSRAEETGESSVPEVHHSLRLESFQTNGMRKGFTGAG